MSARFLKIAVVYLAIGVSMGLYMGITHQFALHPVHAHINLLGWASLALVGIIYHLYPEAAKTRLARIHFWMHNLGLPAFMIGLAFLLAGHEAFVVVVAISSMVTGMGLVVFVVNVWMHVHDADPAVRTRPGVPNWPVVQ